MQAVLSAVSQRYCKTQKGRAIGVLIYKPNRSQHQLSFNYYTMRSRESRASLLAHDRDAEIVQAMCHNIARYCVAALAALG